MGCEFPSPMMVYKATSAQGISSTLKINDLPGATCKWSRKRLLGIIFGPKRVCTHFSNQNYTWDFDSAPKTKFSFQEVKILNKHLEIQRNPLHSLAELFL